MHEKGVVAVSGHIWTWGGEEGGPYKRKVEGNISGMEYPIGDISMSTQE